MSNNLSLQEALNSTLSSLGYSTELTSKSLSDLEQVIAIRFYNKLISMLPKEVLSNISAGNNQQVIENAKQFIDTATLQDQLLAITKEVVSEYIDIITTK